MNTLHTLLAAAALTAAAVPLMASGEAPAAPGPGSEACWLGYEPGREQAALSAFAAPGLSGSWSLRVSHRDGYSFDSEYSGFLDGRSPDPVELSRLVLSEEAPMPMDLFSGAPRGRPGTTVIAAPGLVASDPAGLDLLAELEVRAPDGALVCRTRDIAWLAP